MISTNFKEGDRVAYISNKITMEYSYGTVVSHKKAKSLIAENGSEPDCYCPIVYAKWDGNDKICEHFGWMPESDLQLIENPVESTIKPQTKRLIEEVDNLNKALTAGYSYAGAPSGLVGGGAMMMESLPNHILFFDKNGREFIIAKSSITLTHHGSKYRAYSPNFTEPIPLSEDEYNRIITELSEVYPKPASC